MAALRSLAIVLLLGTVPGATGEPCTASQPSVPPQESSWRPPQYNASVVAAFRAKLLVAPTHFADDNPYKNGTVPKPGRQNDTSVCAVKYTDESARAEYTLQTFQSAELAAAAGAHVTHLHPCGACSSLQDLSAYMATTNLTAPVRSCGLKVLSKANEIACLKALGFTDDCTNIWYYNTLNSRAHCALQCLNPKYSKYPYNVQPSSADAPGPLNPCIQCDEDKSGPIFKQFSGRTRRDSGLLSAIDRPPSSIYEVVHNYY